MSCEVLAVRDQLEQARDNLRHVEEGIKKTSVSSNYRFGEGPRRGVEGRVTGGRGVEGRVTGGRGFEPGRRFVGRLGVVQRFRADEEEEEEEPTPKKLLSSVASRLGPMPKENKDTNQQHSDDEAPMLKSTVTLTQVQDRDTSSSVISDTKTLDRSKRLFGSLLMGTLRQFKQEKEKTKTTETKQAEMWERVEKKEAEQVALTTADRQRLVAAKQEVNQQIKLLEDKMEIAEMKVRAGQEREVYSTYIRTKTKPCIYYQPKEHNDRSKKSLKDSNHRVERLYDDRIEKYNQNIAEIETKLSELNGLDNNLADLNTIKVTPLEPLLRTVSNNSSINPTTGIKIEVKLRDASIEAEDEKPVKQKTRGRQPKTEEKSDSQKQRKSVSPDPEKKRSRSPKRRSRSPRNESKSLKRSKSPRKRSRSPTKRSKSPVKSSRSPRKKSESPKKRSKSPVKRSRSPRKRPASPKKRSKSPVKRSRSPRKKSESPKKWPKSPTKRSRSPRKRPASPKKRSKSPAKKSRSPRKRSVSPRRRSKSPAKKSRSPRKRSVSPRRRSKSPPKRPSRARRQSASPLHRQGPPQSASPLHRPGPPQSASPLHRQGPPRDPRVPPPARGSSESD